MNLMQFNLQSLGITWGNKGEITLYIGHEYGNGSLIRAIATPFGG